MERWYIKIHGTLKETPWEYGWSDSTRSWVLPFAPEMALFETEAEASCRGISLLIAALPEYDNSVVFEIVKCSV